MNKNYLKPLLCIFDVNASDIICTSPGIPTDGETTEQYNTPQDWGGEWN